MRFAFRRGGFNGGAGYLLAGWLAGGGVFWRYDAGEFVGQPLHLRWVDGDLGRGGVDKFVPSLGLALFNTP